MASDDLLIRLGLTGQAETSRGLRRVAGDARNVGSQAQLAGAHAQTMGAAFTTAGKQAGASMRQLVGAIGIVAGVRGIGRLAAAGVKWGLSFNAQVESARERFRLFTNDVNGLMGAVQGIDARSQFNFGDLADAAALLGNQGVRNIPGVLQGIANAAAASGRGTQALQGIAIAIGQIQAKGRLSQEELNQILEAGGPGAQQAVQKAFGLTAKQLQNLGAQGLDARKAIQAITAEWTSGRMASAAERQLQTLGGQWDLLTGNMQKLSGAATMGLSKGLEHDVLPAANRAVEQITRILGRDGLSDEEKLRQARAVIRRELGPVAQDIIRDIQNADLAGKLSHEFERALDMMATSAVTHAPHIVSSFVDAWLGAGPWAKLISGAWLAKKLGLGAGLGALLFGGRGGRGALGGVVSKASPVPVWVVNSGPLPGGSPVKTITNVAKRAAPYLAAGARVGGPAIAAAGLVELGRVAGTHNYDARAGGAAVRRTAAGTITPPGFAPPPEVNVTTRINMDGYQIATGVDRAQNRRKARR